MNRLEIRNILWVSVMLVTGCSGAYERRLEGPSVTPTDVARTNSTASSTCNLRGLGEACGRDQQCCSGVCGANDYSPARCLPPHPEGHWCQTNIQCMSGRCIITPDPSDPTGNTPGQHGGTCAGGATCGSQNESCAGGRVCCPGSRCYVMSATESVCTTANITGEACTTGSDCLSGLCEESKCAQPRRTSSTCIGIDDPSTVCFADSAGCCTGLYCVRERFSRENEYVGECRPKKALGAPCYNPDECISGACTEYHCT